MIPHGNFASYYKAAPDQDVCRKMLNINHDEPLLLFFGNIRPYKGLHTLLSAFELLDSSRPLRLLIAGKVQGDLTNELESAVAAIPSSRIRLELGHIPDDQVPIIFGACDAVVLPYANVLTSGVGLLAASFNKPVIAPSIGCFQDYPSSIRIPFDVNSPENLASVLSQLSTQTLKMKSEDVGEWIKEFDWIPVGQKTVNLYKDIAE